MSYLESYALAVQVMGAALIIASLIACYWPHRERKQ
jgi:hypothetical protein